MDKLANTGQKGGLDGEVGYGMQGGESLLLMPGQGEDHPAAVSATAKT